MTDRLPLDGYYTPQPLADAVVCHLREHGIVRGSPYHALSVLEPSAGKGAFARAVARHLTPYEVSVECVELDPVRAQELQAEGFRVHEADFLEWRPGHSGFGLALGNPPFGRGTGRISRQTGKEIVEPVFHKHVMHALSMSAVVAFVLRMSILGSKDRAEFWRAHPASRVDVLRPRPSFSGTGNDNSEYALYTWVHGDTSMRLGHLDWEPERKRRKKRTKENEVTA